MSDATRVLSGAALSVLVPAIPEMVGGSADLTGSNNTYVKGANTALEQLADARDCDALAPVNMLEKNLAFNLGGHVNHSVFWANMCPDGGDEPDGELAAAIDEHFGSFDGFRKHFTVNALALGLSGAGEGRLLQPPGALEDVRARRLRVLHETSFRDDPTRLLRLARYGARLGFEVPPGCLVAGTPGQVKRELTAEERQRLRRTVDNYLALSQRHAQATSVPAAKASTGG